jgi:hypothetical protein
MKTTVSQTNALLGNIESGLDAAASAPHVLHENFETQASGLDAVQGRGESEVRLDPTGQNATEENPDLQYPTDFEVGSISLSIFDSLSSQAKNQLGVNLRYTFTHLIVVDASILISCCRNSNQSRKAPLEVTGVHPVVNSAGNNQGYPITIAKRMLLSSKCAYQQRAEYLSNKVHCKCAYQQRIKIMTYLPRTSVLTRQ